MTKVRYITDIRILKYPDARFVWRQMSVYINRLFDEQTTQMGVGCVCVCVCHEGTRV